MYTLSFKTPHSSAIVAVMESRKAGLTMLDTIKDAYLKSGEDVTYYSTGPDVRLSVGHDKTYILEG